MFEGDDSSDGWWCFSYAVIEPATNFELRPAVYTAFGLRTGTCEITNA